MQPMGMMIGLRPERVAGHKALHAAGWAGVRARISASSIRNYTIFLREPECMPFASRDYHARDLAADMAAIAADPVTKDRWALTDPCQIGLPSRATGEGRVPMEEVVHHD